MRIGNSTRAHATVAEIAARYGFRSSTTFALEYRKRFGIAPSTTKRTPTRPRMSARSA
jgi:AraC-like DNA-binding protein